MLPELIPSSSTSVCSRCRTQGSPYGHYFRQSDHARVQRYRCGRCRITFSDATGSACFGQKRRDINNAVYLLLTGSYTQRRSARDLGVNRKTIVRKFLWMGLIAEKSLHWLNQRSPKASVVQFDDLETFEHTNCKPLSVTLAVEKGSRRILGFRVSKIPARGPLAHFSRIKYGPRPDQRREARQSLFPRLKELITEDAVMMSDQNPHYVPDVARHFPGHLYRRYKGRKPRDLGLGELKKGPRDPLFSLNHTCAMLRDNLKRLARKSWCTTKKPERLALNIALYAMNHNLRLIQKKRRK